MDFVYAFWSTSQELAPWLFLGAAISALLHVLLPKDFISRKLRGASGIFSAVFLGVPLPLCSCGVIPAGIGLKKDGAEDSAALAFLISTPQTGVDSVVVSAAFLGWPFAIFKLVSATITGIIGGFWVKGATSQPVASMDIQGAAAHSEGPRTWRSGVEHGVQLIRSIWRWLVFGVLLSAALQSFVPPSTFASLQQLGGLGAALAALVISIPLYVCATASVPIAAALVQAGLPLGAALVFLMAGPATNVATIGAIRGAFGSKISIIYLTTVVVGSITLGLGFDAFFAETVPVDMLSGMHEHGSWWQSISAVVLFGSFIFFAYEEWAGSRIDTLSESSTYTIEGLHCGGCVSKLQHALEALDGVTAARVTLNPQEASVTGTATEEAVLAAIESVGLSGRYQQAIKPVELQIEGLHCGGCVSKLTKSLKQIDGAYDVVVTLEPPRLFVKGVKSEDVCDVVEQSGFSISSGGK